MQKPIAILLARMDSKRLPGKHMLPVGDLPIISHLLKRLCKGTQYEIVLATSDRPVDAPLIEWATDKNLSVFTGDAFDIRKRVIDCALHFQASHFARVNADSPFVDHLLLDKAFEIMANDKVDLCTNLFPRSFPYGYSVEVFKTTTFVDALPFNTELENITSFFYSHAQQFHIHNISSGVEDLTSLRMTVDTAEDLDIIRSLFKSHPNLFEFSLDQLVPLFQNTIL